MIVKLGVLSMSKMKFEVETNLTAEIKSNNFHIQWISSGVIRVNSHKDGDLIDFEPMFIDELIQALILFNDHNIINRKQTKQTLEKESKNG